MVLLKGKQRWEVHPEEELLFHVGLLEAVYQRLGKYDDDRYSVPLLVDKKKKRLLSTDSSEIVPYTARGFRGVFDVALNIVTPNLLDSIDIMNRWLHESVNRAVYLMGFSTE